MSALPPEVRIFVIAMIVLAMIVLAFIGACVSLWLNHIANKE